MMSKLPYVLAALVALGSGSALFIACGSETDDNEALGDGGATDDALASGDGFIDAVLDSQRNDAPDCKPADGACTTSAECCTTNCVGGKCSATPPAGTCKLPAA